MRRYRYLCALAGLFLLPAILHAEELSPTDSAFGDAQSGDRGAPIGSVVYAADEEDEAAAEEASADAALQQHDYSGQGFGFEPVMPAPQLAVRFGYWGVDTDGALSGVGQYQGLQDTSPFFDVDGITSDGLKTIDFTLTGTENESNIARGYFYSPLFSADLDYRRFIHRLGHKPLEGFNPTPITDPADPNYDSRTMWGEDLNVGDDYALRVQQLDIGFQGNLNENVRWRLNLWGMRKHGERQQNAMVHCYNAAATSGLPRCHNVSQSQRVDWLTMQVEPVIEARFDWLSVEYSRTMRTFQNNDELLISDNTATFAFAPLAPADDPQLVAYGIVPENYTEIDRIKTRLELTDVTELYTLGYYGNTHNRFRDTDRKFWGGDIRLTNRSFEDVTFVGYGKAHVQDHDFAPYPLNDRYDPLLMREDATTLDAGASHPVDRTYAAAGVKSRWTPFVHTCDWRQGLSLNAGYEWSQINRRFDVYELSAPAGTGTIFEQPNTETHMMMVGANQRWSRELTSFARYIWRDHSYPLVGITPGATFSVDASINSNLPEHEDLVELGSTWSPTDNFLLSASVWLESTYNRTEYVNFDEDRYPFTVSAWYAPSQQWSFSAGYYQFTNWINQDITLGGAAPVTVGGPHAGEQEVSSSFTAPWRYGGQADVINLGGAYLVTPGMKLTGGFDYTRGRNRFAAPPTPDIVVNGVPTPIQPYTDLPGYSEDNITTYRFTAGVDYELTRYLDSYLRYNYYDWDDLGNPWMAGTAHMVLAGVSGVF